VLATAGGGADGFELLSTFIAAAAQTDWHAVVISGPDCPPERVMRLRAMASGTAVSYRTFIPGLRNHLRSVDVLVCMGGYNTLTEAVASGVPTVCVPRVAPRREQLLRAQAFARRGLLRMLEPSDLQAGSLRAAIQAALAEHVGHRGAANHAHRNGNGNGALDTGGAERAARQLLALAGRPTIRAGGSRGRVG
jgi:predicted glycosyltransferase